MIATEGVFVYFFIYFYFFSGTCRGPTVGRAHKLLSFPGAFLWGVVLRPHASWEEGFWYIRSETRISISPRSKVLALKCAVPLSQPPSLRAPPPTAPRRRRAFHNSFFSLTASLERPVKINFQLIFHPPIPCFGAPHRRPGCIGWRHGADQGFTRRSHCHRGTALGEGRRPGGQGHCKTGGGLGDGMIATEGVFVYFFIFFIVFQGVFGERCLLHVEAQRWDVHINCSVSLGHSCVGWF